MEIYKLAMSDAAAFFGPPGAVVELTLLSKDGRPDAAPGRLVLSRDDSVQGASVV